ncbi:MAG: hypothetical protein J7515_00455 [Caulobacter sp.]|nr:hypothetical protein [Caulobacter sp.]
MTHAVDNDTALEEVLEFLADPPPPGTPEDARFGERLRQVLAASLVDEPLDEDDPTPKPELAIDDDLRRRLESAAKLRSTNPFGEHPGGIGPTLGMDLRKS